MSDKTFSIQALLNQRIPRKKLLLLDIRPEFFTKSSCLTNRLIFKTYRFGIAIYFLTWFISKRRYKSYDINQKLYSSVIFPQISSTVTLFILDNLGRNIARSLFYIRCLLECYASCRTGQKISQISRTSNDLPYDRGF